MRRSARVYGMVVLSLIALCAGGCRTWQSVGVPEAGAAPRPIASGARIIFRDGRQASVDQVRFARDSLHATRAGAAFAVPADGVRRVEVQRLDWLRTLGLGVGLLAALYWNG